MNKIEPVSVVDFFDLLHEYKERDRMVDYYKKKKQGRKKDLQFRGYLREASLRYKSHSRGCNYTSIKNR